MLHRLLAWVRGLFTTTDQLVDAMEGAPVEQPTPLPKAISGELKPLGKLSETRTPYHKTLGAYYSSATSSTRPTWRAGTIGLRRHGIIRDTNFETATSACGWWDRRRERKWSRRVEA